MDALVPRVQHLLVLARAAARPELAVDESDQVVNGQVMLAEGLSKVLKVIRPRGEGAVVDQVRELSVHVLHLYRQRDMLRQHCSWEAVSNETGN